MGHSCANVGISAIICADIEETIDRVESWSVRIRVVGGHGGMHEGSGGGERSSQGGQRMSILKKAVHDQPDQERSDADRDAVAHNFLRT
jgi:hypothetical protein